MINTLNKPEILAPCGSYEILVAAILAGADACYIGGSRFGARAYAENLSSDSILKAIDYAHLHDAKLYLTVNTLFKDSELSSLYEYLLPYYRGGLDAVIVQDLGTFSFIKEHFPDLHIHCSTQMNITSYHAAKLMHDLGATRIVTAREMQLDEIAFIKNKLPKLEIESFVHGAMCYSYSGQCLLSSLAGGRSGNRGRCAQPCRKQYQSNDDSSNPCYLLSMKDMCALEDIPKLLDAGIDSLKIEGRMKNEYYVASAVDAYRTIRDAYRNHSLDEKLVSDLKKQLAMVFNRGGFSKGYYFQKNGSDMISKDRPNNQGTLIGTIQGISNGKLQVSLVDDLYKQDVLEILLKDGTKMDVTSGISGKTKQTVYLPAPSTKKVVMKQKVYRTRCNHLLDHINDTILKASNFEKVPITASFTAKINEPIMLSVSLKGVDAMVCSEQIVEAAKNTVDSERVLVEIREKMNQLGNTDYFFENPNEDISIDISENAFVPMGLVKKLRRDAIVLAEELYFEQFRRNANEDFEYNSIIECSQNNIFDANNKRLRVEVTNTIQLQTMIDCIKSGQYDFCLDAVYMNYETYQAALEEHILSDCKVDTYIALPYIVKNDFSIETYLAMKPQGFHIRNIDGFAAICEAIAQGILPKKIKLSVASSLYTYNSMAYAFLCDKFSGYEVTFEAPRELNLKELQSMQCSFELPLYGRIQVMLSAQCIHKTLGCCDHKNRVSTIRDDLGNGFVVMPNCKGCYNLIYNEKPMLLFDKLKNMDFANGLYKFIFTTENEQEVKEVFRLYEQLSVNPEYAAFDRNAYTTGHLFRGVE